jgi:hypothetical protein
MEAKLLATKEKTATRLGCAVRAAVDRGTKSPMMGKEKHSTNNSLRDVILGRAGRPRQHVGYRARSCSRRRDHPRSRRHRDCRGNHRIGGCKWKMLGIMITHFRNLPSRNSSNACCNCSCVFMTIGPYHATGSLRGSPDTSRNRMPSSPA